MLKIGRRLGRSWSPICGMTQHQYFSVLFMNEKKFYPAAFDVSIPDIDEQNLHGEISKILGKTYLAPLQKNQKQFQETRTGVIYGNKMRGMISLPTRATGTQQPIWVHYLVDPGSPYTFLTKQTLNALKFNETHKRWNIFINGFRCLALPSTDHFSKTNILGMNFIDFKGELTYDLIKKKIKIIDGEKW